MASNSTGSSQGQRRQRQVGLANPRSARGRANEEEAERVAVQNAAHRDQNHQEAPRVAVQNVAHRDQNHLEAPRVAVQNSPRRGANQEEVERVALQNIMNRGDMGLDVQFGNGYEDSSEFESSMESVHVRSRALTPEPEPQVENGNDVEVIESPPEVVAARSRAYNRNRYFWVGNDGKLNLMASKYLNQPLRQEIAANASGNADSIAHIRSLKRDAAQDLDYNNLKHSGKLFLVQATTDELNACDAFKQYMPESQTLSVELCRQKIKEFQAIAVGTSNASIDRRKCNCIVRFYSMLK